MRFTLFIFLSFFYLKNALAQKISVSSEVLSSKELTKIFHDTVRKSLNINFPIFMCYKYSDKSGNYYCVLTESRNILNDKDTFNNQIKAINIKVDRDTFIKIWEIKDNVVKNENQERSIWFWSKYIDLKDYDNDNLVDPIIVYGTQAANGYDDGRIKFIICYKGQKIAIRHQNGVLDFERETQVDKNFYTLPQSIQNAIKKKMELMMKNKHAIFPSNWQTAMKNQRTNFNNQR